MKKYIYWIIYALFVVSLGVGSYFVVDYVSKVVTEYESSQPEYVVEAGLNKIKSSVKTGKLASLMTFPVIDQASYDSKLDVVQEYRKLVADTKEWTYKIKSGSYSEESQEYGVFADGNMVATIRLKSLSSKNVLSMLTMNDWVIDGIDANVNIVGGDYVYYVPVEYHITVNGVPVDNDTEHMEALFDDGIAQYTFSGLYNEPEIVVYDDFGHSVVYGENAYFPCIYSVYEIPSNYTITSDIVDFSNEIYCVDYDDRYEIVRDFCDSLPNMVTYQVGPSLVFIDAEIKDNLGNKVEYVQKDGKVKFTEQATMETVPEYILNEFDPMEYAKEWSIFMTSFNQVNGRYISFNEISKRLITDSYLYKSARSWAYGIDATFTSNHSLMDPIFVDEKIGNYLEYSDDCFSVDVYFGKRLRLTSTGEIVIDKTNSTFYFKKVKNDDGSFRWCIVDIRQKA